MVENTPFRKYPMFDRTLLEQVLQHHFIPWFEMTELGLQFTLNGFVVVDKRGIIILANETMLEDFGVRFGDNYFTQILGLDSESQQDIVKKIPAHQLLKEGSVPRKGIESILGIDGIAYLVETYAARICIDRQDVIVYETWLHLGNPKHYRLKRNYIDLTPNPN